MSHVRKLSLCILFIGIALAIGAPSCKAVVHSFSRVSETIDDGSNRITKVSLSEDDSGQPKRKYRVMVRPSTSDDNESDNSVQAHRMSSLSHYRLSGHHGGASSGSFRRRGRARNRFSSRRTEVDESADATSSRRNLFAQSNARTVESPARSVDSGDYGVSHLLGARHGHYANTYIGLDGLGPVRLIDVSP